MKVLYVAVSIVAVALVVTAAPRARAQTAPSKPTPSKSTPQSSKASSSAEASAREHFQRGQRLTSRGEYAAAYREFAAGYALTELPVFLFNMGEAARASGDVVRARDSYQRFIQLDPGNSLVPTAQARLAALGPSPAPGSEPAAPAQAGGPGTGQASSTMPVPFGPSLEQPVLFPPPAPSAVDSPRPISPMGEPLDVTTTTEPQPLWKKWPFWAGVAGTFLVAGIIIYSVGGDERRCGPGCTELNFR